MKLREIAEDFQKFYDMADDENIDEESWFGMMEQIDIDLEDKAEAYANVIADFQADADKYKEEADRLAKKAKTISSKAAWLKRNLEAAMIATGKTKFKTEYHSFNIQNNPPALKFDEEFTTTSLPIQYLKIQEPKVDTDALKAAIKDGQKFDHVSLVQSQGLRIR